MRVMLEEILLIMKYLFHFNLIYIMKYDFIIIGGGISCLYFLKKMKDSGLKIAILEKKPNVGGRIKTVKIGDDIIDTGSLRFTKNHKILLKLLKEYNINDILPLVSKIDVKIGKDLMKKIKKFLGMCKNKKYQMYAFGEVAKNYFTEKEYETFKLWFGYDYEWDNMNCQLLAKTLMEDYDAKNYFHLQNGLSQLPNAMYEELKEVFDFHLGEKVKKISEGNNVYTASGKHFTADKIIFACPPHYIKHIDGTHELDVTLSAIGELVLNRMYAKFKDGSWFPDKVWHSHKPISQTVPINDNIIMISYSTNNDAKFWIEKEMNGSLWKELKEELGMDLEKPEWIKQNYWNPATHFYNPGFDPEKMQEISFKPLEKREWYIIGEAFSLRQGWIEGALENTELFHKKYVSGKFGVNEKKFSMSEVKKHNKDDDAWIVLFGNVYDITDWIKIHPGGDVIKYGIGKDATEMFLGVGHQEDAMHFLNNYKIGII